LVAKVKGTPTSRTGDVHHQRTQGCQHLQQGIQHNIRPADDPADRLDLCVQHDDLARLQAGTIPLCACRTGDSSNPGWLPTDLPNS
jgi:hypothetical protein